MKNKEDIFEELENQNLSKETIKKIVTLVKYIYIGQNIRNEGILQDDEKIIKDKEITDLLLNNNIILSKKWYSLNLFILTNFGIEIGEILIKETLEKNKGRIKKDLEKHHQLLIGFLVHNYFSEDLSFYLDDGVELWDWRDLILRDSRIKREVKKIFNNLINLNLCVITHDYVSTRRGEKRGRRYVISAEIRKFLLDLYPLDGLSSDDKINCKLADILLEKIGYVESGAQCSITREDLRKEGLFDSAHKVLKGTLDRLAEDGIIKNLAYTSSGNATFSILEKDMMEAEISELTESQIDKLLGPEAILTEFEEEIDEIDIEYLRIIVTELIENKVQLYRLIAQLSHGKNMFNSNPNTELFGLNLIEPISDENELKNFIVNLHQFIIECSAFQILRFIDRGDFWDIRKNTSEISPKEFMDLAEEIDDSKIKLYEESRDMLNNLHNLRNHYSHLQDAKRLYESSIIFKKLINMSFPTTEEEISKVQVVLLEKIRDALVNLCEVFTIVLYKKK